MLHNKTHRREQKARKAKRDIKAAVCSVSLMDDHTEGKSLSGGLANQKQEVT